jgi:PAS domain S-box-containing protein
MGDLLWEHMFNDIDEELQAEVASLRARVQELERTNAHLAQQLTDQSRELELFKHLAEHAPDGVVLLQGDEAIIVYMNPVSRAMIGYAAEPEDLHGRSLFDVVTPESAQKIRDITRCTIAQGEWHGHVTYQRRDGSLFETDMSAAVMHSANGKPHLISAMIHDASDEVRQEQELCIFEGVAEHAPDGIAVMGLDNTIIYANAAYRDLMGYGSETVGLPGDHCFAEPQRERFQQIAARRDAEGQSEGTLTYHRKDGTTFEGHITTFVVRDTQGNARHSAIIVRDMSEQVNMQHELRQNHDLLQSLLDHSPAAIYVRDLEGHFVMANQQYAAMFYTREHDVIGKTPEDLFPADIAATFRSNDRKVFTSDAPLECETSIPRDDGDHTYLKIKFPLYDEQHNIYAIGTIATDITERKRVEATLHERERELHRFYLAVEQSASSILIMDSSGVIEYVNSRFTEITGYRSDEAVGQHIQLLQWHKASEVYDDLWYTIQCGHQWHGEFRSMRKDGEPYWFGLSILPITSEVGGENQFLAVGQDITERKLTAEALHRHDAILEAVGSAAERFLRVSNASQNIDALLERLGKVVGVSHVYVFENERDSDGVLVMCQRYQWADPAIVSEKRQEQFRLSPDFARWEERLSQGYPIHGSISTFPLAERSFLENQDICSTIVVPIFVGQRWWGCIGLDEYHEERVWSDAERDALRTAAGIIGAAIQREQVEAILHEREADLHKFYLAVEQSASSIIIANKQGVLEYINPRFTQITGYNFDEVVGRHARILKSDDISTRDYRLLLETITSGQQWRGEFRSMRKNGEPYWLGISILPITNEHDHVTHFLAVGQDITDRKVSDEAIRNHLQFLATLLDTIPSPVFYQSTEGVYLGCNQLFATQIVGLSKEKIIGKPVYTISGNVPAEKLHIYRERDQQLCRSTEMQKYEEQVQCADGMLRDYVFSKATFTDAEGEIAGIIGVMLDISERKRTEEALRRGEERFRLLAENARDMIFRYRLTSPRGFEYVSPSVTKIMGYTPEEYYNDPDIDLKSLHPESRPVFDVFRESLDSYKEQVTMRYIHKDGRDVWIEQSHWQVLDEAGKPMAIEGIARDITERMKMEAILRIQHDLAVALSSVSALNPALRQVLITMMGKDEIDCGGIYLVDRNSGDLHMVVHDGFSDQFAERIAHHPANASLVQLIRDGKASYQRYSDVLLGPFDMDRWNEGLRAAIIVPVLEGTRLVAALYLASHTHDEIPLRARAVIEAVAAQIGGVIARLEAETALRESQNNLQTLFDTLDDFLCIFDTEGYILHVNPIMQQSLGYAPDELHGMHILNIHPVEQRDAAAAMLTEEHSNRTDIWFLPLLTRDGMQIPVETKTTRGNWNHREVFFSISRDITERQRAQVQLIQQEQALATLRERERLARELHDTIGQVLGYVNTQSQAVQKHIAQADLETAAQSLKALIGVTQDAQADVRQFIIGVKASTGMSPRAPEAEQGFFQSLEEYLQRVYTFYGLRTELVKAATFPDDSFAPTVEVQLLRIIQEALTNIRKHAEAELAKITFSTHDHYVRVTIEDDGKGFDLAQLSNDSGQNYGMRSMRERAEEVGGNLLVYSAPGEGTRVIVHIPLRTEEGNMFRRVMLVDDHPLFLEGIRNLLTACGLDIIGIANDGFEAQKQARVLHPDVILMDINMPNCNGLEATRLIKSELPNIQIVMLTTSEDDDHLFEAIKSGASGYLLKSLDAEDLFEALSMLARGETPLPPGLASKVLDEFVQQRKSPEQPQHTIREEPVATENGDDGDELTPRQMEVLTMVAQGMTYKQVGEALSLTERTIKYHMGEIIHRLHVNNRVEAVAYAMRLKRERND